MQSKTQDRGGFLIGNSRSGEWKNLKLYVARDRSDYLTMSLIVQTDTGLPFLDPEIRGLQTIWYPQHHQQELKRYALSVALLRLTETRS